MRKQTGKWLRELRIINGLKQREAAELFSTNRITYSCWESKYKKKILPKNVLKSYALKMLILQHPAIPKNNKNFERKEEFKIIKRIKKWIIQLLSL